MNKTILQDVGGSLMLAIPTELIEQLHLEAGTTVELTVDHSCIIVKPNLRSSYTIEKVLAISDYSQPGTAGEREWIDTPAVGGELI